MNDIATAEGNVDLQLQISTYGLRARLANDTCRRASRIVFTKRR